MTNTYSGQYSLVIPLSLNNSKMFDQEVIMIGNGSALL